MGNFRRNYYQYFKAIPKNIWALGFVSMLMDMSSELIFSILPIFMVSTLGASMIFVGVIEGIAEGATLIVKIISGSISDVLGRRKWIAVIGYGISAISKPLFPLSNSVTMVFFARFFDRIGKGIRGAPRDALIGEIAPKEIRGTCFGLRQALDTVGAVLGPLLGILLMYLFVNNIHLVFWIAVIPAFISVGILAFVVTEPLKKRKKHKISFSFHIEKVRISTLRLDYWKLVIIGFVLTLARFSQAFLILKVQSNGLMLTLVPIVLVIMNIFNALSGYPAGILSDYKNRKFVLLIGVGLLIVADLILGFSSTLWIALIGVSFWGLHMGFTEGLLAAMIADTTKADFRGTAYGIYNFISGIGMLIASILAGVLWDRFGSNWTFLVGASFALIAFLLIVISYRTNERA